MSAGIVANKIIRVLGSKRFFIFVLAFFVFESAWIALSALYPQAFDENFHFGLIKIYSHYWLPFFSGQPPGANAYGAVARDPSYLYHYLMSFPYRILALIVHSQTAQVILFRFINIGLFSMGLVMFRQVLLRVGLSRSLANTSLLLFILIPIVPLLAAQVNYDNLLFALVAWACLQTFDVIDQLRKRRPSVHSILLLLATCLFASLVKYAFLPIFLAIILFLLYTIYQAYGFNFKELLFSIAADFKKQSWRAKLLLAIVVLISFGMFAQRDGLNLVKYHNIAPDCSRVLNVQDCNAYSPWYFNFTSHQLVVSGITPVTYKFKVYTKQWFYWMWYRLFFAVNGLESNFVSYPPLPLPSTAAWVLALLSLVVIIWWWRRLFYKNPYTLFVLALCLIYTVALFARGYSTYKYTDILENMNGRYLLPILPLFVALAALALSLSLRKWRTIKVLIVATVLLLFLQGGGLFNFILRSDESWDWPNHIVVNINNAARKISSPIIIKNPRTPSTNIAPSFID